VNAIVSWRTLAVGLALVATMAARAGWAATVVLVRPANPKATTAEALVRMHGELVSAGFDVQITATTAGADPRASLEQTASGTNVDAVVAILGDASPDFVEVWVIDRVTGKSVVRRIPSQPESDRAAEILAIRAIELLRASLLEVAMASGKEPPLVPKPPPAEVTRFVQGSLDPRRNSRLAIEVGGSGVASFDGVGLALLPMIRLDLAVGWYGLMRVTLAGLGTRSNFESSLGSARVSAEVTEQFGLVEAGVRLRPQRRLQPFFSLGAGARHTSAEGRAPWPYQGQTAGQWSFLVDAGTGMRLSLHSRFEIALEVHAQLAHPYPVIRVLTLPVATAGRPDLLPSLTLIAWL
jgi:hypothetical protein